jgi:hypothetical protein
VLEGYFSISWWSGSFLFFSVFEEGGEVSFVCKGNTKGKIKTHSHTPHTTLHTLHSTHHSPHPHTVTIFVLFDIELSLRGGGTYSETLAVELSTKVFFSCWHV